LIDATPALLSRPFLLLAFPDEKDPPYKHWDMSSTQVWLGSAALGRRTESAAAPRVAIYLRVSTGRQAEQELSFPDQKAQAQAWVAQRG
jgi:hypothetical protein